MTANFSRLLIHDRQTRISLGFAGLWLVAYIAWTILDPRNISLQPTLATFSLALIQGLAAFYGFRAARNPNLEMRLRKAWGWISRALIASAIAEGLWFVYSIFNLAPLPWLTDVLYFLYYAFILIGLLHFPFVNTERTERTIFRLDLAIVMLATLLVIWTVNINHYQEFYRQDPLVLVALVFPFGDAVLFAGMAALLQRDLERVGRYTYLFLTLAFGLHGLAEGLYLYARMHWYDWAQPFIYIFWLLGAYSFMVAAIIQTNLVPATREIYPSRTRTLMRLVLPYLAVLAGWSTLIYITIANDQTDIRLYGALFGSLLLGLLVLWRQYNLLVENINLYADMQRLAITDSLTGIFNRHYFNQVLGREHLRAERYNLPLALLLVDVDEFKLFNDTLGHLQGDQVLKLVSTVLNTQLRRVDLLARFGGDEFAVIMPGTDHVGAVIASKRIQSVIQEYNYAGKQLGLSIGVAVYITGMTPEQFVEKADRDLYRSKSQKTVGSEEAIEHIDT